MATAAPAWREYIHSGETGKRAAAAAAAILDDAPAHPQQCGGRFGACPADCELDGNGSNRAPGGRQPRAMGASPGTEAARDHRSRRRWPAIAGSSDRVSIGSLGTAERSPLVPSPNGFVREAGLFGGRPIPVCAESAESGLMNRPIHTPYLTGQLEEGAGSRFLTLRETAAFLNVHPNTVRSQVRRGKLPGAKIGRGWRFLEADLVASIRARYPESRRDRLVSVGSEGPWRSGPALALTFPGARQSAERALDALLEQPAAARPARAGA